MKNLTIAIVVIVLAVGGYFVWKQVSLKNEVTANNPTPPAAEPVAVQPQATTSTPKPDSKGQMVLGTSVEGRDITAYHFGTGAKELVFVGGAHGGYEWNTVLVAYQLIDSLQADPSSIPSDVSVTVIPVLNPDGLYKVVGTAGRFTAADVPATSLTIPGRYNAHNVDLNRNFDCDWQSTGTWQNTQVSGGSAAFSEPESNAFKSYISAHKPAAVVVWFSAAGGVFSSSCGDGVPAETSAITKVYADASGYPAFKDYDFYDVTGDMVNWLAKNDIPGISVLLTTHTDTEWTKNKAGILALFNYYAK